MGDPKKPKKKYIGPSHPWQKARIELERDLMKEYGIKNKKELWKMDSIRKKAAMHAKKLIADTSEQGEKERQELVEKLARMGFIERGAEIDDILSISLKDVLERRLQTMVFKRGLAHSIKQARQFIVHGHITVNGKKVTSPSYIVLKSEEDAIGYSADSRLIDENHPERIKPEEKNEKEAVKNGNQTDISEKAKGKV